MKEIKFNYCIPREYINNNNETCYSLAMGGEQMNVETLTNIQKYADITKPKCAQPWLQVFDNGRRVTNDNINWSEWNGITFSDVDTKLFYKHKQQFDVKRLLNIIHENIKYKYNYNYYCCYISPGGLSYRILYYWNCERTEENFMKCALLTEQYTRDLFYSFGTQGKEIIDFTYGKSKVLDSCSKSSKQGLYLSNNKIMFSEFTDDKMFGSCDIEDINIEQLYKLNIKKNLGGDKQIQNVKFNNKIGVDVNNVNYYPHHYRRCIYEALMVLFNKDKNKVNEEWEYIARMIPESDGDGGGHSTEFYINEPEKNKWFDRFNDNVNHSLHWLEPFGYKFEDKSEYIYFDQFRKSWKHHIKLKAITDYIEENNLLAGDFTKKEYEIAFEDLLNDLMKTFSIFDKELNGLKNIDEYRNEYYKTRFDRQDFKYLCNGYQIAKDVVTYKMYADFYYRDEHNLPIIKYNILEDDILTYGYWPETDKMQYHTLKFNDEYTHWKNNDEFSNKAVKSDMRDAISKYVPRWFTYHSIKDYLYGLDLSTANEELLETWAIRYFNADDNAAVREISKKFFIAAVKKMLVEDPTTFVFQHMLFLQGPTGCGKTFFLVNMFTIDGHSYILNKIDPNANDKDIGPMIAKNWLIQFGESENLQKITVNAQKEFVDRINLGMKYQKKFENEQTTVYPRVVVCRTSNDETLFNDISISEGDRRNWLIVCNCDAMSCDDKLKNIIKKERDILWATAMKLYIDDPEQDLELSNNAFVILAEIQENFKMIKNEEINEIYNEIFDRNYITNSKKEIQDEFIFCKMLERSDSVLNGTSQDDEFFLNSIKDSANLYNELNKIDTVPGKWLKNFIMKKYGISTWKLFRKYLIKIGFEYKNIRYGDNVVKSWIKTSNNW